MRRLIFALAAIAAGAVFADRTPVDSQNFDSAVAGAAATTVGFTKGAEPNPLGTYVPDESKVAAYATTGLDKPTGNTSANYLEVETGSNTLSYAVSGATYLDTMVQFQITKNPEVPEAGTYKIAFYLDDQSNLKAYVNGAESNPQTVMTGVNEEQWYRLTVGTDGSTIKVYVDQTPKGSYTCSGAFASVDIKGSGALEDFALYHYSPFTRDVTISALPAGLTATYQIGDEAAEATTGGTIKVPVDAALTLVVQNADGATKTYTDAAGTSATQITVADSFGWPEYLGAAVDGAYVIDTPAELVLFKKGVAKLGTSGVTFKLGANIDATELGYFDGIGTASGDNGSSGLNNCTFDGAGYTISNVKFTNAKYRGFFNQVLNSTIKDLTINVVDIAQTSASEHGYAAFVGNMKGSTILRCKATGTLGTTAKPTKHTSAGFAVKVDSAGVFVDCTNEVDIVCSLNDNPKVGGFVGLMQGGALTNCWNFGDITITCKKCGNDANGAGGLIGYGQSSASTISGGGNSGTIQTTNTTADGGSDEVHVGTLVGMMTSKGSLMVTDGTVAQAGSVSLGKTTVAADGLNFATVSGTTATFVADNALAAGNTYKVMAPGATATYEFTSAGTITFETNLIQTVTYAITATSGLKVTHAGTVYTASAAADAAAAEAAVVESATGLNDDSDLQKFLGDYGVLNDVDLSDSTAVAEALNTEGSNGMTYKESYVLGLDPSDSTSTLKVVPASTDSAADGITLQFPGTKPASGVTVTYKVYNLDTGAYVDGYDTTNASAIKIPLGSGRYRVDAVIE